MPCKKGTIFRLKNLICSTYNVFVTKRICSCHLASAYVRDFYVRLSCAKVLGTAHTLCNDEIFPDSFLRCRLLSGSDLYRLLDAQDVFTRTIRNRLLPSLSNGNCCIGEIHVIMHARSKKYVTVCI